MNKTNLLILADYLDKLPADYDRFDMADYATVRKDDDDYDRDPPDLRLAPDYGYACGAVCCAIGHGPAAGLPTLKTQYEGWSAYYYRVFGLPRYDSSHSHANADWTWCFHSDWRYVDNTPQGAAWRIRYLVEHGTPPSGFKLHNRVSWEQFAITTGATS